MKRRDFLKIGTSAVAGIAAATAFGGEALAEDAVIVIKGARMVPSVLTVKKGQIITIVDGDNLHHSIFSETPGMEMQCSILAKGAGVIKFEVAGTATIECAEHPTEVGNIKVVA
jgi:plastocyanin